jgi:LPS-assembly lipoprotein
VFLLSATLLLTACGFHLQNKAELPPEMSLTYLEVKNPYSRLAQRLETLLEQNGAKVVTSRENAAVLEVPVNSLRKLIQAIGDNARVREYQIRLTVNFRVLDSKGEELIPMQVIELSRVYSFNEQDILAAEREDEYLRQEVSDTVASMMLRRIGTWTETATP